MMVSYYEVLSISPTADLQHIKLAYKQKLLSTHPDKILNTPITNSPSITVIQEAYQILSDPELRKEYDENLNKSAQKQGFNLNGDGLDIYDLADFKEHIPTQEDGVYSWTKDCPRCTAIGSFVLDEEDLEENSAKSANEDGYEIVIQCNSCSLWLRVRYYEGE